MKGFVPVTKEGLVIMLTRCLMAVDVDYATIVSRKVAEHITREKNRIATRNWYRLWGLPAARFEFNEEGVRKFASEQTYAMFEGDPFVDIEEDKDNSIRWIESLMRVATNANAGEPISLDIDVFKRISSPELYTWVSDGRFYKTVRW